MPPRNRLLPLLACIIAFSILCTLAASLHTSAKLSFPQGGRRQRPFLHQLAASLGFDMATLSQPDVSSGSKSGREELTLMTFNIRYNNGAAPHFPLPPGPDDTFPNRTYGEWSWTTRKYAVSDIVIFHHPDIAVFQEVLHSQLEDLVYLLGDDYEWIGVGRDDGKQAGEAVPVFFKKDKFHLVSEEEGGVGESGFEHFWLSDTPSIVGSVGWDAALTRMCTHLALRFRLPAGVTRTSAHPSLLAPIHIFSTHYDHQGTIARAKSSELIVRKVNVARDRSRRITGEEPLIILAGDLNSPREERGWQNLVRGHHGVQAAKSTSNLLSFYDLQLSNPTRFGLPYESGPFAKVMPPAHRNHTDLQRVRDPSKRGLLSTNFGPSTTFTDWGPTRDRSAAEDRIDFIMVGDNQPVEQGSSGQGWRVKTAGVVSSWSAVEGGIRGSDHRPVIARLRWEYGER